MKSKLRSQNWFGKTGKDGFIYRAWMKNQGIPDQEFRGKPVIGICNTWSELTPCNGHFRELADVVKRGVSEAGGFPAEFPVMSLGETLIKPTAKLYRNLASMDVEESIRAGCLSRTMPPSPQRIRAARCLHNCQGAGSSKWSRKT